MKTRPKGRPDRPAWRKGHAKQRAALCVKYGVKNTGRQWRKLRKWLRLQGRAAEIPA